MNNLGISSINNRPMVTNRSMVEPPLKMPHSYDKHQTQQKNINDQDKTAIDHRQVSEEELINAIEKANSSIKSDNTRFEYSIHEETKRIMVKVVNPANDEIIREIPPEKVLDMVAKIWEISGILVDEKR